MTSRPDTGERVHYADHGGLKDGHASCRTAVVTNVPEHLLTGQSNGADGQWAADLEVSSPTTTFLSVPHDADALRPGTWHRPDDIRTEEKPNG
jgi:hypothetical protein